MSGPASDELTHLIRQIAGQQIIDYKPHVYGYIANYDPARHVVKVIIPALRDQDGAPVLSEWMPLGAAAVGNGFGIQAAPFGGATADNPTGGEQVLVSMFDRQHGVLAAPCMFYTDVMKAPSPALATPLQSGEMLLFNKSGSFIRFHAGGQLENHTQGGDFTVTVQDGHAVTLTANGSTVTIDVSGNMILSQKPGMFIFMPNLPSSAPTNGLYRTGHDVHIG